MAEINYNLPTIDAEHLRRKYNLNEKDTALILSILHKPVNGRGVLKGSKPKEGAEAAYLWRTVMMLLSPEEKFHSVVPSSPVSADATLHVTRLADLVIGSVDSKPGETNWKEAMGY